MLNHSETLDRVFASLADPTRRAMVEKLTERPRSVSELAEPFEMSLPAVMQHLQVLEGAGLVKTEKVGRVRTCTLESKTLRMADKWISDRKVLWEKRFDRLEQMFAEEDNDNRRKK